MSEVFDPDALWRPANGCEGDDFESRMCMGCACDENTENPFDDEAKGCPILAAMFAFDIGQPEYPTQIVQGPDGIGHCTAFVEDVGQGWVDPYKIERDKARYGMLMRDPVTGRPVIR